MVHASLAAYTLWSSQVMTIHSFKKSLSLFIYYFHRFFLSIDLAERSISGHVCGVTIVNTEANSLLPLSDTVRAHTRTQLVLVAHALLKCQWKVRDS